MSVAYSMPMLSVVFFHSFQRYEIIVRDEKPACMRFSRLAFAVKGKWYCEKKIISFLILMYRVFL